MKIQALAVIFIIIMLPISLVLEEYTRNQAYVVKVQAEYDSRLRNATYDAVKVFQMNTINSDTSDLSNSKMRDINASVNSFYSSLAANFNMEGYNKDALSGYVPAVVFTMYDGYYIYTPYTNEISNAMPEEFEKDGYYDKLEDKTYYQGQELYGLKPYIYYSSRFVKGNIDVVITFALDNYVSIDGKIGDEPISIDGYVIDVGDGASGMNIVEYQVGDYYIDIPREEFLSENLPNEEYESFSSYEYVRRNGVTYYKDEDVWFTYMNGTYYEAATPETYYNYDDAAIYYFSNAKSFQNELETLNLTDLTAEHSTDDEIKLMGNIKVFDYGQSDGNIENFGSDFNMVREAVIKNSIQSNLSIAISNYNNNFKSGTSFQMPELTDIEWEVLTKDVSVISFLQGLNIGSKEYNGHSIVPNTKTKEVITEDSIYIDVDDVYYKVTDEELLKMDLTDAVGRLNLSYERRSIYHTTEDALLYYYPSNSLGSYTSIITSIGVNNLSKTQSIYEYLSDKPELAQVYYTALRKRKI